MGWASRLGYSRFALMRPLLEYFVQTVAPLINAVATATVAIFTIIYVRQTRRMVDEITRQSGPYVFLKLRTVGDREILTLVNSGGRVAMRIVMKVTKDAKIYVSHVEDDVVIDEDQAVSGLPLCKQGMSSLPPSVEAELGFTELRKPRTTLQSLEYIIRYRDGSGRTYKETLSLEYFW